jgi:uncharacterized protein YqhQ
MEKKITSIGGQAIIEGVMMRGPEKIAMSVRKPDGEIVIEEKDYKRRKIISKIPIVRGIFAFFDSLVIGVQSLMFSAKFFDLDDGKQKVDEKPLSEGVMYLSVFVSVLISIGLFILLPNFISGLIVANKEKNIVLYNIVESVIKLVIFLSYLVLVSRMKDIQRVFEYHGAEHKSIFCYENGEELTVENVKKYPRFHPRCGTSFLLFVIIVSIIVFSLVGRYSNPFINMGIRILLLPIVAGLSYEIIRYAGKSSNKFVMLLNKPGMWLQRLTTREPDDSQIEVAIKSLVAVIPENKDDDTV